MSNVKDIQTITLDFSGIESIQTVTAKQFDERSRYIQIKLISNGEVLSLSENENVDFRCIKPDKTSYKAPAIKNSDGTITVELNKQTLAVSGIVKADIVISDADGKILSSTVFNIRVEPAATNGNYIPSKSEEKRQADFDMDGHTVKNLAVPVNPGDAVTKDYFDRQLATLPIPKVDQTIAERSENAVSGNAVKAYVDGSLSGTLKQYSSYYDRETLQTGRKTVTYDGGNFTGRVGKFAVSHQSGSQYASFEEEIIFGVQPHDSSDPEDFIPFFSNSPTAPYMDGNMYIGMMGEWMSLRDLLVPALTEAFGENAVVINESLWQPSDNDWGGAKLGACRYWYLCEIHVGQDEITALDEIFNGIIQLKNMAEIRFDWRDAVNKTVKEAALL